MGGERRLQFCQKQFEMGEKKKKCFCSEKILLQWRKLTKTFFNEKKETFKLHLLLGGSSVASLREY